MFSESKIQLLENDVTGEITPYNILSYEVVNMDKKKRPNITQTDKGDRNAYQNASESICHSTKQSKMYED